MNMWTIGAYFAHLQYFTGRKVLKISKYWKWQILTLQCHHQIKYSFNADLPEVICTEWMLVRTWSSIIKKRYWLKKLNLVVPIYVYIKLHTNSICRYIQIYNNGSGFVQIDNIMWMYCAFRLFGWSPGSLRRVL